MAKKALNVPADKSALYEAVIATNPKVERKVTPIHILR